MIWASINIASAIVVSMIVAYKLGAYPDHFNLGERVGMGLTASGMLMRIGPILGHGVFGERSPFDDWSVTVLHVGLAVYFSARIYRVHKHWLNNERAKRAAREWMGGVGR